MTSSITPKQQEHLDGLRSGDIATSWLKIEDKLTDSAQESFVQFRDFLQANGHPNPQPDDLYLTVAREDFLTLLQYADNRNCLILQCCFGFNRPPIFQPIDAVEEPKPQLHEVGRILLLNKGNFHQLANSTDDDFFNQDTVFQNADGKRELFRNIDITKPVTVDEAAFYQQHFRAIYTTGDPILGYQLPVRALKKIVTNRNHPLGRADQLTFRWGLDDLDNFTLIIGTSDLLTSPTVEFMKKIGLGGEEGVDNDCPPNRGCN